MTGSERSCFSVLLLIAYRLKVDFLMMMPPSVSLSLVGK